MTERLSKGERRQHAKLGPRLCNFDMGSDAPDPGPAAAASEYAATKGFELGTAQMAEGKRQYDQNYTALMPVVQTQLDTMKVNASDAQADRNYNLGTYRPLEQSMVADATNFNTEAEQARMAGVAGAGVRSAQARTQADTAAYMAARGINVGSGKFAAMKTGQDLKFAAEQAGAENASRIQTRAEGQAMKVNAVGLGKGLTGAAQGAYGLAIQAGDSAGKNIAAPGAAYLNSMDRGAGTVMQGAGMQVQGLTSMYGADSSAAADAQGGMMGLVGAGIGAAATIY